jgi:hypothetical protein
VAEFGEAIAMTNSTPPDPNSQQNAALGLDEIIAIIVAFVAIGGIFFWSVRREPGLQFAGEPAEPTPTEPTPDSSPLFEFAPPVEESPSPLASPSPRQSPSPLITRPTPTGEGTPAEPHPPRTRAGTAAIQPPQQVPQETPSPSPPVASPSPTEASPSPPESPSPTPTTPTTRFPDVPGDYWASPFIATLAEQDIITGTPEGEFEPEQPVTRAEFAIQLQEAFDREAGQELIEYGDIPEDDAATEAIREATQMGFLTGYPGGSFRPNESVSRLEVLIALVSGLNLEPPATPEESLQVYEDSEQIPDWAQPKIAAATEAGIVVNYPNPEQLNPSQPATRAETAALLHQALVEVGQAEPVDSEYVVRPEE